MIRHAKIFRNSVSSIVFDRAGSKVFTASWKEARETRAVSRERSVQRLDTRTGYAIPILPGKALTGPLARVGDTVVSSTRNGTVVACHPESGRPPLAPPRIPWVCTGLLGSPKLLVLGSCFGGVRAWDNSKSVVISGALGPSARINDLCASSDGLSVYAIQEENIACWSADARKRIWKLPLRASSSLSLSPDGRFLYVGSRRSGLACLDAATGKTVWQEAIPSLSKDKVSICGRFLFFASGNRLDWRRIQPKGLSELFG
ncbi:quinon protein alcohol dehydrogenase-like superfamily [Blyttiomyces helicus]|uniref:Quinon protein alcohol dehydrogenase-like superfamily n=1 Tax=Blyttiomyces helicus TaxID=388810 RepID=A0A4P9W0L5_9FUNG|nr:quinon protein alcohol dehydrogenase-like superfamily [Blyttiomyces helicus]|eukprot:RKO85182.1 quinon protein alcohol dehydrogenase-like superfamily [Blyttiomyces helicus]